MEQAIEDHANAFVAMSLSRGVASLAEENFKMAYHLTHMCEMKDPIVWWEVIRHVVSRYNQADLVDESDNEAKAVLGHLAAGPLEDLLSLNGNEFIQRIEDEAQRDTRFQWMLSMIYKFDMADEIWIRVRIARGDYYQ